MRLFFKPLASASRLAHVQQPRSLTPRPGQRLAHIGAIALLVMLWSLCLGLGLAQALEPSQGSGSPIPAAGKIPAAVQISGLAQAPPAQVLTPDLPEKYRAGQAVYLQKCATCHLGLPPEIFPTETWQQLIQDTEHYGTRLPPLFNPDLRLVWDYLKFASRSRIETETIPYRIYQSRYFKALHPRVKFAQRVQMGSCINCHIGAKAYDFRQLSPEWDNAP
jgi:hypothetical protein